MVNRSSILPTERISFFPYEEDVKYLRSKYGVGSAKMGYGPAMREIIHAAVKKLREKERTRLDSLSGALKEAYAQGEAQLEHPNLYKEPEDVLDPSE